MIKVGAGELHRAMRFAAQVVESRNTIPILANVMLEARDNLLAVTATDLDVLLRQDVPASTEGEMVITIPSDRLAAIASAMKPDATLTIRQEPDANRVTISAGRSKWTLASLPRTDFPSIARSDAAATIALAGGDLAALIERVLPFRSTEETRHYLNGPLWHGEDGMIALAATNGHQLMRVKGDVAWPEDAPGVILAPKAAKLMSAMAQEIDQVTLVWNDRQITATLGRAVLVAKVIDGTFPDYRRVIPGRVAVPAVFDPEDWRAAIGRLMIARDRQTSAVLLDPLDAGMSLAMNTGDGMAAAVEEVDLERGDQPATCFNAAYLKDLLAAIGGDTVELHQADGGAPALFVRKVEDGAVAVLMPMRR